ncbi:BBP7 family outer membrane beta-barrel protein [Adhaeretor mobilis]|nr:BBP7 family outer membrane beta-barrel protein [Adhaeretor mobilis]
MTARNTNLLLATTLLLLSARTATAQVEDGFCEPACYSDAQYFAPVDFDYDCNPIRKDCGYTFSYDRIAWYGTGERHPLGLQGGQADGSFNPFRIFETGQQVVPIDPADPDSDLVLIPGTVVDIPTPFRPNGIMNAAPRAEMGYGHRYELGYFSGDAGWLVGILDGPDILSAQDFGFGYTPQDNTNAGDLGLPSDIPNNPNNQLLSPFGSVHIVFEDPDDLMLGFIDVYDALSFGNQPGNILAADTDGDGVLDGDGFADDIDNDGVHGPDGFDSEEPGDVPDSVGPGVAPDFDDLVRLPTSWQSVQVRNRTQIDGIEIMRTHRLSNRHKMAKNQNSYMQLGYGVRYYQLDDKFRVDGQGGVMGDSFWDTSIVNNIVGPQVALNYKVQKKRFLFDFNGRCLLGYNIQNMDQTVGMGEDLIYAQNNHPLNLHPTYANHGKQEEDFSPVVEIRANASYQVTGAIALRLGYTGTFVDNIRRASQHVRYRLPDMGFREGAGTQDIFINGVNVGVEAVY